MKRLLVILAAFFFIACQAQSETASYRNLGPAELNHMLANKDFVFVNVHIPFEGDIAGTDLSIPYDQITDSDNLALLPSDKDAKIVLYCRSGRMSEIAANALVGLDYTNIWNLDGGMIEWERQGFEIVGR